MKLKVIHFQRKSRLGFNYSIESIFKDLRCHLKDKVEFTIATSSRFNDGYASKIYNIIEAFLSQQKNAIAHITGETYFLNILMRKKKNLLTVHDCRFMERKKGLEKKIMSWIYLKLPVQHSAYVVSVSESTKKDIIYYTHCKPEKIKVIYNAVPDVYQPQHKNFNNRIPVILQIGTAENKNLEKLIEALKNISCHLIIIGQLSEKQLQNLKAYQITYANHYNLSNEQMLEQYHACDILAFVSTSEGFGMPIVEANCVERVVITSNISSMPEIAGDAACLVDPHNVEDIRNGILRVIHDKDYREQLIENGRTNKLRFNGEVIAEQYYQLYKKIAEEANLRNN